MGYGIKLKQFMAKLILIFLQTLIFITIKLLPQILMTVKITVGLERCFFMKRMGFLARDTKIRPNDNYEYQYFGRSISLSDTNIFVGDSGIWKCYGNRRCVTSNAWFDLCFFSQ